MSLTRRTTLGLLGAASFNQLTAPVFAQGVEDRKFIFILLRGGMDGLSALTPDDVDELSYMRPKLSQHMGERINLSNGFRLHPTLTHLKTFYDAGDVTFIHACSTPYRQRSHFEAQDMLELLSQDTFREGWLNRTLSVIGGQGLAVARSVPLAMLGPHSVANWSPSLFDSAPDNLLDRLADLYAGDSLFSTSLKTARQNKISGLPINRRMNKRFTFESTIALKALGERMSIDGGPGIGMVALDGWDTHANQANLLNRKFNNLNEGLHALKQELANHWDNTCIVIASEFGRTAAMNGTRGTDHGTGGLMMLLGGVVKGGNVKGDWPGIRQKELYKGRDLAPANDVTAILKGVLRDHLGIDRHSLDTKIFPNSSRGFDGLIKS